MDFGGEEDTNQCLYTQSGHREVSKPLAFSYPLFSVGNISLQRAKKPANHSSASKAAQFNLNGMSIRYLSATPRYDIPHQIMRNYWCQVLPFNVKPFCPLLL